MEREKTSLAFQIMTAYALAHPNENILAIDMCPQANLSELLLGGLEGTGGKNLDELYNRPGRCSIGGYFQKRIPQSYQKGEIPINDYIAVPSEYNTKIPDNIKLLAGDKLLEIQSTVLNALANNQLPGVETRIAILNWINDFIDATNDLFDTIFIDTNPSFSIHTQIALAASERLILPIMADDSSRRAIINVFTLIYGSNSPNEIYKNYLFSSTMEKYNRTLPKVHLIVKNRITQYMGAASGYASVLDRISQEIQELLTQHPNCFSFTEAELNEHTIEVTDFGTTGVVAFAEGTPFRNLQTGIHKLSNRKVKINKNMLEDCIREIDQVLEFL